MLLKFVSLKTTPILTTSPLSNFMSSPFDPRTLKIQLLSQLYFNLALHYFVVWSFSSIRLRSFILGLYCDIKVVDVLVAIGKVRLELERNIYCLARLRPIHYLQARGERQLLQGRMNHIYRGFRDLQEFQIFKFTGPDSPLKSENPTMLIRDLTLVQQTYLG